MERNPNVYMNQKKMNGNKSNCFPIKTNSKSKTQNPTIF